MLISPETYYIVMGSIATLGFMFLLVAGILKYKNLFSRVAGILLLAILIPLYFLTPTVVTVTGCGAYTKEILLLPENEYSMGKYNYIINNSDQPLSFFYIQYGKTDETIPDDVKIEPGKTHRAKTVSIDYLFKNIPSSITIRSRYGIKKGETRSALQCE